MKIKENTHVILKREDIERYCNEEQKLFMLGIETSVMNGRIKDGKKLNAYIICNTDEQYYNDMYAVLCAGEEAKERGEVYKSILPKAGEKETRPLKVFTDGEYEWYTGYSLEEFKNYYCNVENRISEKEFDEQEWHEVPEIELDDKVIRVEDSEEKLSLREAMTTADGSANCLIAWVDG